MKIILFIIVLASIIGCKKDMAPTDMLAENVDTAAKLVASGSFQNGPYGSVMGKGQVFKNYDGTYAVVIDSFMTNNGPDLFVYLSKEPMPVDFINAGKLKSTNGRQVYPLASMPDLTQYKYVCIHCKQFNHLFGYALLQ